MKFRCYLCVILALTALLMPVRAAESELNPAVYAGCSGLNAARPVDGTEKLLDNAKAVVLYERSTMTMVYTYRADEKIYPSSMVKLMTALVALEKGDLADVVTVSRRALDSVAIGSVSAGLLRGEELTLEQLLYCMMVASANDAAAVIAEHIAGSQDAFVAMMNEKADQLGCTGTNFTNVHGLHHADNYSTARDILKITEAGLNNEVFRTMFQTAQYTVPKTNLSPERVLNTTNHMMSRETNKKYFDSRVTGGKTGTTDDAGRCLTVTATVGNMELIGIVMGAKATYSEDGTYIEKFGSFEEMDKLLDHAQENYECRQLFYTGQIISQYPVSGGSNNAVSTPAESCFSVVPRELTADQLSWNYEAAQALTAPVKAGQTVGRGEVWYGDICLAATDLVAVNDVAVFVPYEEPKSAADTKQEERHGELLATVVLWILVAAVGVITVVVAWRLIQNAMIKARLRRRRKNRRRNRLNVKLE